MEKPNLGPNNDQLEIIEVLDNLAWELRIDFPQYEEVEVILDNEIYKSDWIQRQVEWEIKRQREQEIVRQLARLTIKKKSLSSRESS